MGGRLGRGGDGDFHACEVKVSIGIPWRCQESLCAHASTYSGNVQVGQRDAESMLSGVI